MRWLKNTRYPLLSSALSAIIALHVLACMARASGTNPSPPRETTPPPEASSGTEAKAPEEAKWSRADAEKLYAKGWEMSEEAKQDLAKGKAEAAKKRFGKALKKFDEATRIDPTYYQAWNMVGFCARKSGDLKRAFEAYQKCLAIEPEYAEAHEYLGEAYLMSGDLGKAKAELAWLRSRKSDEAAELAEKIEAVDKGGSVEAEKAAVTEEAPGAEKAAVTEQAPGAEKPAGEGKAESTDEKGTDSKEPAGK